VDVKDATVLGDPASPSCAAETVSNSVWYSFTPATTQLYTISASKDTATTVQDTVMAIYTSPASCGGPFTAFACNDDAGDLQSAISTNLTAGTAYYIVVWMASTSPVLPGMTSVQLRVSQPVIPPNDMCAGAETIPGAGPFPYLTTIADTTLATTNGDPPMPSCQPHGLRSVWYRFTPSVAATYDLSLCTNTATTVYDTLLAVYSSANRCSGPLTLVACNDDACDLRSELSAPLAAGVAYYIVVWEAGTDPYTPGETSLQLQVSRAQIPTAVSLAASGITSTGAVLRASVNPRGAATTTWFEWGVSNYTNSTQLLSIGSGSSDLPVSAALTGLAGGQTYLFHIRATNSVGSSLGNNLGFAWSSSRPSLQVPARPAGNILNLNFTGATNQVYWLQASTNLKLWTGIGLATDLGNGAFQFTDSSWTNYPVRFYRVFAP
jgi:hypothetical protein